jgi:hypothetical protein
MAYISLDDIRTKSVEEIFEKMSRPYEPGEREQEAEPEPTGKELVRQLKRKLKGWFKDNAKQVYTGNVIRVGDKFLTISGVLPSSGRAFFKLPDTKKNFSLPIWFLTGETPKIKFKKGDLVKVQDQEFKVVYVNPASNSIQLDVNGILRRISLSKIQSLTLYQLLGNEMKNGN